MKKILLVLCIALFSTSSFAARNDSGSYGGFQLGIGNATSSGSETTLSRSTAYGGGFELGYMVNNNFSLELSYSTVGGPQWDVVSVTDTAVTLNALFYISTSDVYKNAIYILAGGGSLTTSANLSNAPNSRSNHGGIAGIGYEFNHGEMTAFRIGVSTYDTGYNQVNTLYAGPVWKF